CLLYSLFFLLLPPPPTSTLFPYTTLFRSPRQRTRGRQTDRRPGHPESRSRSVSILPDGPLPPLPPSGAVPSPEVSRRAGKGEIRSEEHTSELQSQSNLVCRLLLEKKKKKK